MDISTPGPEDQTRVGQPAARPLLPGVLLLLALTGCGGSRVAPDTTLAACGPLFDTAWMLHVDRIWTPAQCARNCPLLPSDEIADSDYQPTATGATWAVRFGSHTGATVSVGQEITGSLEERSDANVRYGLDPSASPTGGRFVVWCAAGGFEAELTHYGSGLPIVGSQRGALRPAQPTTARPRHS